MEAFKCDRCGKLVGGSSVHEGSRKIKGEVNLRVAVVVDALSDWGSMMREADLCPKCFDLLRRGKD